jgi:hypothetical protein
MLLETPYIFGAIFSASPLSSWRGPAAGGAAIRMLPCVFHS